MKKITLSKKALRVLYINLENNAKGYDRKQLRRLDKILLDIFDPLIKDYSNSLEDITKTNRLKIKSLDPERTNYRAIVNRENILFEDAMEEINKTIGISPVDAILEDADFDFVKAKFDATDGFIGSEEVRRLILEVDSALENPKDAGLSPKEDVKKNNDPMPSANAEDKINKPASPAEPTANAAK